MLHIVEHMVSTSPDKLPAYIDYRYFPDDELLAADFSGGAIYKWLEENNLLHREPVPYYAVQDRNNEDCQSGENMECDLSEPEPDLEWVIDPDVEVGEELESEVEIAFERQESKTLNPVERTRLLGLG